MANIPPRDNNGVIAGRDAALVVDAGITSEISAEIDLGARTVQLWHSGPGNGPCDTVVYIPDTRIRYAARRALPCARRV